MVPFGEAIIISSLLICFSLNSFRSVKPVVGSITFSLIRSAIRLSHPGEPSFLSCRSRARRFDSMSGAIFMSSFSVSMSLDIVRRAECAKGGPTQQTRELVVDAATWPRYNRA